ncbi:hypothetical protein [Paenibacillus arenilitoris]|uniref:Uncharacterized protein n=1 Tax=Paenibacillus arenilitoris TaxID=2772299 RepID=A0A927CS79_9BACL|nr:hypothetical protein [Paenibacillus arenilitoris]MBD2872784.1 hypothetical protein [Paenibacillus arenilitoris]
MDEIDLPADWNNRELPPGASETDGKLTIESARPYQGDHEEIHLVLAGPEWMERWGLDRPLEEGESIEVVGYLNTSDDDVLRPVMFWLADGQGVWQQLTAFPDQPEPAPSAPNHAGENEEEVSPQPAPAENNMENQPHSQPASPEDSAISDESNQSEQAASSATTWLVVGVIIVAAVVAGAFYLIRQGKKNG